MKVLFCHDGPISKDKEGSLYTVSYTDEIVSRYYEFGDDLNFLIRTNNITSEADKAGLTKMSLLSENIIEVPNFKTIKSYFFNKKKALDIIQDAVKETDFVIVRLPSSIGRLAAEEALKQGKPYLVEVVGHPFDILWYHSWKGKLLSYYESEKNRNVILKAPFCIYVTKTYLQKEYPCNGLIAGIADTSIQIYNQSILDKRKKKILCKLPSEKIVVGTIGSTSVKYKGQEYVIKALSLLKKKGITNIEYQLVGGGKIDRLKKIAKRYGVLEQIVFKGNLKHLQVFEWLDSIDIYIQPSMTEGLPRSVVEAMSRALPCIVSDCGGNPELIESQYIYNKKTCQAEQIAKIVYSMSANLQLEQAVRNFSVALKYSSDSLDKERNIFYKTVKKALYNYLIE